MPSWALNPHPYYPSSPLPLSTLTTLTITPMLAWSCVAMHGHPSHPSVSISHTHIPTLIPMFHTPSFTHFLRHHLFSLYITYSSCISISHSPTTSFHFPYIPFMRSHPSYTRQADSIPFLHGYAWPCIATSPIPSLNPFSPTHAWPLQPLHTLTPPTCSPLLPHAWLFKALPIHPSMCMGLMQTIPSPYPSSLFSYVML